QPQRDQSPVVEAPQHDRVEERRRRIREQVPIYLERWRQSQMIRQRTADGGEVVHSGSGFTPSSPPFGTDDGFPEADLSLLEGHDSNLSLRDNFAPYQPGQRKPRPGPFKRSGIT